MSNGVGFPPSIETRQSETWSGSREAYNTHFPSGEHAGLKSLKPLVSLTAPPALGVTRQMFFPGSVEKTT